MKAIMNFAWIVIFFLVFSGCDKDEDNNLPENPIILEFNFDEGAENWLADFADYPEGEEDFYELDFGHATLPIPLDTTQGALMITGNNHSDDLFMFIYYPVQGLLSNATYDVDFELDIASDAADDSFGVGGSPGSGVYLKAGVITHQPEKELEDDHHYRVNFDKANQAQDGEDMMNLGDVSNGTDEFEFAMIHRSNDTPFRFQTDSDGNAWVVIGTDSGFEATTTLFYDKITVVFTLVEE